MAWKRTIEIEADSLEEAERRLQSELPRGFRLVREEVLSSDAATASQGAAETVKASFKEAEREIPGGTEILEKTVLVAPVEKTVTVEAFDEESAEAQARPKIRRSATIKGVTLRARGKPGFLGIGRKPNSYEVEAVEHALVRVTYKNRKAKIRATIIQTDQITRDQIPGIVQDIIGEIEGGWKVGGEGVGFLDTLKSMGPDVLPVLVEALKEKANKWPRSSALCWASGMYEEEALPLLIELLSSDDGAVRSMAEDILCCLGSSRTQKAVTAYEAASGKGDEVGRKAASSAIAQTIRDNSVQRLDKKGLVAKLVWLSSRTNYLGPGGLGFALARDIGQRLDDLGGIAAMRAAYHRVGEEEIRFGWPVKVLPGDAASLNWAWASIGGWMP